jgi:hypothetical protein
MTNIRKHIKQVLKEESYSDLKKPFMKYEKLINKLVYEVFDEGICSFDWEVVKLHEREGISIRIILHFTEDSFLDFDYERYGQSKQELKGLIEDFLPKFNGIFIAYDTTKCDDTQKEEETEGVGGYAAPAFEMKPDHVHFKHLYNEAELPIQIRRRANKIDRLVDVMLNDMYVDDYDSEKQFFDGVVFELGWLVRNEDFELHDVEWMDIYDYIDEYRRDDINEYYKEHQKEEMNESEITERCWKGYTKKGMKTMFGKRYPNCVKIKKKKSLKESIKDILDEEVTKKYSKPTPKVEQLVYRWLNDYFDGAQMYHNKSWESTHSFEFCNNGKEILDVILYFHNDDNVYDDKRKTEERDFEKGYLMLPKNIMEELSFDIPVRISYLKYIFEEWFDDTYLGEIQKFMGRNDIYISEFDITSRDGQICVPPVTKPEGVTDEEMMDYIKKNTMFSYEDMEKHEEEDSGWIEKTYLDKLRQKEHERLNG